MSVRMRKAQGSQRTAGGRARQNGDHRDHGSWKVLIFDGKFYLIIIIGGLFG